MLLFRLYMLVYSFGSIVVSCIIRITRAIRVLGRRGVTPTSNNEKVSYCLELLQL